MHAALTAVLDQVRWLDQVVKLIGWKDITTKRINTTSPLPLSSKTIAQSSSYLEGAIGTPRGAAAKQHLEDLLDLLSMRIRGRATWLYVRLNAMAHTT